MSENDSRSQNVDLFIDGEEVPDDHFQEYIIERDMFQPDMASLILNNQGDAYSNTKIGAPVEVKVGDDHVSIYKGEVVGVEPQFKGGGKTQILIRCLNKLHRLLRMRKSVTYVDKTDEEILRQVVQEAGLTLEWKGPSITYKHVYQHNETNLQFLRTRAARLGCHVWCVDTKVYVKEPDFGEASGVTLKIDESNEEAPLQSFMPRMSSAGIVKKVTVKGWNPEKKEPIVGTKEASGSKLGSKHASEAAGDLGKEETFVADHPIWSKQEADAIAKARLTDLSLTFITGEAQVAGVNADLELGKTVKMEANAEKTDDPFNGAYYIMGITHRHRTGGKGGKGGKSEVPHMILKLARDAQG